MGTKKILQHTRYGPILAKRPGESLHALVQRQSTAFKNHQGTYKEPGLDYIPQKIGKVIITYNKGRKKDNDTWLMKKYQY